MKQSVMKIMPIKKLGRKGERGKQCLLRSLLHLSKLKGSQTRGGPVGHKNPKIFGILDNLNFVYIRIFISFTQTHQNLSPKTCYRRNEQDNRRTKDQKVREIEHVCFMSLVWTSSGDIGHSAKVMYKLAAMIVLKHDKS